MSARQNHGQRQGSATLERLGVGEVKLEDAVLAIGRDLHPVDPRR
jgi:hypothetical protein